MHPARHSVRRRPIGAIIEARRREKAAIVARATSFAAIAEALTHYARDPLPVGSGVDWPGAWELLGEHVGAAAAIDRPPAR
jgi:hypothetical protein